MGVGSSASVTELRAEDNGIDGVHVGQRCRQRKEKGGSSMPKSQMDQADNATVGGQGAELTLKGSVIERSRRMGVSALGAGTRALLQDN
eukprot:2953454-Rhodomonas_salina.1